MVLLAVVAGLGLFAAARYFEHLREPAVEPTVTEDASSRRGSRRPQPDGRSLPAILRLDGPGILERFRVEIGDAIVLVRDGEPFRIPRPFGSPTTILVEGEARRAPSMETEDRPSPLAIHIDLRAYLSATVIEAGGSPMEPAGQILRFRGASGETVLVPVGAGGRVDAELVPGTWLVDVLPGDRPLGRRRIGSGRRTTVFRVFPDGPPPSGVLLGTVQDLQENFLAGAEIALFDTETPETWDREVPSRESETDAAGRFSFSGLAPGRYALRVAHRGHVSRSILRIHMARSEVDLSRIHLRTAPRADVRVVGADGRLISGCRFGVEPSHGGEMRVVPREAVQVLPGSYLLQDLPEGQSRLVVLSPGMALERGPEWDLSGGAEASLTLHPRTGFALHIRVTDNEGGAVSHAWVEILGATGARNPFGMLGIRPCDERGELYLENLPPDVYRIRGRAPGHYPQDVRLTLSDRDGSATLPLVAIREPGPREE